MRERPECKKGCGVRHWYFVKCENAEAFNAREDQKPPPRDLRVIPVFRSGTPFIGDRLTSLEQTGANTFWRKRDDDQAA